MNKAASEGLSLWRESYAGGYPELKGEIDVDVAVIGAGISGLSAAYLLKKAGKTVAVIDKDTVGGGTTGRTTGKVTSQHGLIYSKLINTIGEKDAKLYASANEAVIAQIERIIRAEDIDCQWQRRDNYVFTANSGRIDQFREEATDAASLDLPAEFVTETGLPFEVSAAVRFRRQASINAQKYVNGLARTIDGGGSFVFEHTSASGIRDGDPAVVTTDHGKIVAEDIIVATNVPTWPLMARAAYCVFEYPTESYIVAGRGKNLPDGMYISPDPGHYSILPIGSGDDATVLIGGESHLSGLRGNVDGRYEKLSSYAKTHFGVDHVSHRWSDRDYIAYDEVPLVGKVYSWSKHLYLVTALKKWGLTGGTVAGVILRDKILGSYNRFAYVFHSPRIEAVAAIPRKLIGK